MFALSNFMEVMKEAMEDDDALSSCLAAVYVGKAIRTAFPYIVIKPYECEDKSAYRRSQWVVTLDLNIVTRIGDFLIGMRLLELLDEHLNNADYVLEHKGKIIDRDIRWESTDNVDGLVVTQLFCCYYVVEGG